MKVAILDKQVRENLALFKHLILREAKQKKRQLVEKTYKAYINRKTGIFSFPGLQKGVFPKEEWKAVVIRLHPEEKEGAFEVLSEGEETCFNCDLEPRAYTLFTKTIHVLNQICKDPSKGLNPFWILRHVSQLDFEIMEEVGKKNLIYEAWHDVSRSHAESLLDKKPNGTYLFRKDEFAQELEESLNNNFPIPINCITLTYKEDEKICERTLIFKNNSWLFYNDDPTLSGKTHTSLKELLESLGKKLSQPYQAY